MKRKTMKRSKRKTIKRKTMKRSKRKTIKRKTMKRSKRKTMKRKKKINKKKAGAFMGKGNLGKPPAGPAPKPSNAGKGFSERVIEAAAATKAAVERAAAERAQKKAEEETKRILEQAEKRGEEVQQRILENLTKKYEENYPGGKQLDGKQLLDKRLDKREIKNLRKRLKQGTGSKESSEVYVAGIEGNVRKLRGEELYGDIPSVEESRLKPKIRLVNKKKDRLLAAGFRPSESQTTPENIPPEKPEKPEPYQKANSDNSNEWEMSLG